MKASLNRLSEYPAFDESSLVKATLSRSEFEFLSSRIREIAGIHITEHKVAMVESRLQKRLRTLGIRNFSDYINLIDRDASELTEFINALTTNKTEFFREPFHFEFLTQTIIPKLVSASNLGVLSVWCAAASTGEEPYTIAMVLSEALALQKGWDFRILATDIDTKVLQTAEHGKYRSDLIHPVPFELQRKYLQRGKGPMSGQYRIAPALARHLKFRPFNLVSDELQTNILFDIIFLRNVLIYFQPETIQIVIDRIYSRLKPGGYLFIGHSETLNRVNHKFRPLHSAIYQKN